VSAPAQHKQWCSGGAEDVDYAFEIRAAGLGGGEGAEGVLYVAEVRGDPIRPG
jgi:hypothetical protein